MSHNPSEAVLPPDTAETGFETRTALFRAAVTRSWPLFLGLTVAGTLLGSVAGNAAQSPQVATAVILLNPLDGNAFYPSTRGEQLVNMSTEAQVLRSDAVATTVQDGAAVPLDQILRGVNVEVPVNTQILQISYTSPDREVALNRAQGFADAYLAYRKARAAVSVTSRVEGIKEELASHQEDLSALTAQLAGATAGSANAGLLLTQVQSVSTQISQLQARLSDVATTQLNPGQVITPAQVQQNGFPVVPAALTLAGATAGLLLAVALGLLWSRPGSRQVIRSAAEIRAFKIRTLASHPGLDGTPHPTFSKDPAAPANPSLGQLGAYFLDVTRHHRSNIIVVSAAGKDAAAPLSVVSMAWSLAASGIKTVVVDTTGLLVIPPLVKANRPGLTDVLGGHPAVDTALVTLSPFLEVMGRGTQRASDGASCVTPRVLELINSLAGRADVMLVASGPLLSPDTQLLASTFKSSIIEIAIGSSKLSELRDAVGACRERSVHLHGAVVLEPTHIRPAPPVADSKSSAGITIDSKNNYGKNDGGPTTASTAPRVPVNSVGVRSD